MKNDGGCVTLSPFGLGFVWKRKPDALARERSPRKYRHSLANASGFHSFAAVSKQSLV
jgi:hypothetical protein